MSMRKPIAGRGSPGTWAAALAWGCTLLVASVPAGAQEQLALRPAWSVAERPAAMVIVQPPPRSHNGRTTLPDPPSTPAAAVQLAPLPPTAPEEVAPLPASPQARRQPVKRSLPTEFRAIGELTASSQIGTSNAEAEVSPADRPPETLPAQEPIAMASNRSWSTWAPASPMQSVSVHRPLYFEDANLERYGTSRRPRLQPLGSAAHFLGSAASLPYQMALQRPEQTYQYTHPFEAGRHGYRERTRPPCDRRAALVQASVIVGLVFFLP